MSRISPPSPILHRLLAGLLIRFVLGFGVCCCLASPHLAAAPLPQLVRADIDWASFLARQDPVWETVSPHWYDAPFLGNGTLGTMVKQTDPRTLRWDVGSTEVEDHRDPEMIGGSRLPIGFFTLATEGDITAHTARLDLWNAEARGSVTTTRGRIEWRSYVHADDMLIVAEIDATGGESGATFAFKAEPAVSPRFVRLTEDAKKNPGKPSRAPKHYDRNPDPVLSEEDGVRYCTQGLLAGGETVTAWTVAKNGAHSTLYATVAHTHPDKTARNKATATLRKALAAKPEALTEQHRAWWHLYLPESFVSFSDPRWESFYWIQIYKLGAATRPDRALIDNQGPWLQPTPWPGAWWNLNVQLSYWPAYTGNHLGIAQSLSNRLDAALPLLIKGVRPEYQADSAGIARSTGQTLWTRAIGIPGEGAEVGNLLWACHNYWLHYRYSMHDGRLRDNLFPLLRRAVNYYLHFLKPGDDGRLHIPKTHSPEYGEAEDCNYDLALLRWGCSALLQACERLKLDDPLVPRWKEVLAKLADYPVDENGYRIGRDVPFAKSHRHFSHLLMVYPLRLVDVEEPATRALIEKSVKHWHSFKGALQGYSFTGGALIYAALGKGDEALATLNGLNAYLQPSTMYREAGPVIETPLSGAQVVNEMLLQSHGDVLRVFPAVPGAWSDVSFHNLLAEGAFLVSAAREGGKTSWVRVKSLAGERCRIRPGITGGPLRLHGTGLTQEALKEVSPGIYEIAMRRGREALLYVGDQPPTATAKPVPAASGAAANPFGLKMGGKAK